jgi:hypothetical protein
MDVAGMCEVAFNVVLVGDLKAAQQRWKDFYDWKLEKIRSYSNLLMIIC